MVHTPTPTVVATDPAIAVPSLTATEIPSSVPKPNLATPDMAPLYSTGFTPLSPKSRVQVRILLPLFSLNLSTHCPLL